MAATTVVFGTLPRRERKGPPEAAIPVILCLDCPEASVPLSRQRVIIASHSPIRQPRRVSGCIFMVSGQPAFLFLPGTLCPGWGFSTWPSPPPRSPA